MSSLSLSLSLSSSSSSLDDSLLRSLDLEFLDDSRRSSISSSSSTSSVRWKDNIITQICTRPRTNKHDIPLLYYTKHEIRYFKARFGHLPRLEHRAQDACIDEYRHEHRRCTDERADDAIDHCVDIDTPIRARRTEYQRIKGHLDVCYDVDDSLEDVFRAHDCILYHKQEEMPIYENKNILNMTKEKYNAMMHAEE